MASIELPQVFPLSLSFQSFFDTTYSSLIDMLNKSAYINQAKSSNSALRYLDANNPWVIIVTDEGLTRAENRAVLGKVQSYLRNGGSVIFALHFTCFTNMDAFDNLFKSFGVPWVSGDYHRTDFQFNPSCTLPTGVAKDSFPSPYSMKVLHVKNARPEKKIFVPVPGATMQSLVFAPSHVDQTQAAVVGAKVGNGFLFYAGDVNAEKESAEVILALCGF